MSTKYIYWKSKSSIAVIFGQIIISLYIIIRPEIIKVEKIQSIYFA